MPHTGLGIATNLLHPLTCGTDQAQWSEVGERCMKNSLNAGRQYLGSCLTGRPNGRKNMDCTIDRRRIASERKYVFAPRLYPWRKSSGVINVGIQHDPTAAT